MASNRQDSISGEPGTPVHLTLDAILEPDGLIICANAGQASDQLRNLAGQGRVIRNYPAATGGHFGA
jgi:hypothetical protein